MQAELCVEALAVRGGVHLHWSASWPEFKQRQWAGWSEETSCPFGHTFSTYVLNTHSMPETVLSRRNTEVKATNPCPLGFTSYWKLEIEMDKKEYNKWHCMGGAKEKRNKWRPNRSPFFAPPELCYGWEQVGTLQYQRRYSGEASPLCPHQSVLASSTWSPVNVYYLIWEPTFLSKVS